MTCPLEYHGLMRRRISALVAVFGPFLLLALGVSNSAAQVNGVPSSVTSPGFGGHATNGTPASVTSLGPRGFAPSSNARFFVNPPPPPPGNGHHHHPHDGRASGGVVYAVPVVIPYGTAYEAEAAPEPAAEEDESEYQGGPTIFDRRGSGDRDYVPPVKDVPVVHPRPSADDAPPAPEAPPDPTVLVYKDGRKLEVGNYAIVGQTLYDLTPGHPRKVALADLDVDATQKLNDDHGVTFQLPPTPQAN
jgi:hypothetical protein